MSQGSVIMAWATDIPMSDTGWREISLSAKGTFSNVRLSPVADSTNNIAGKIYNASTSGKVGGIVNPDKAYEDGKYIWYPAILEGISEPLVWIAIQAFELELGAFVNIPKFYDLPFGKHGTIRVYEEDKDFIVATLRNLASFVLGFTFALPKMKLIAEMFQAFADYLTDMDGEV